MIRRASTRLSWGLIFTLLASVFSAHADTIQALSVETVQEATCGIIENAAHATGVPVGVLTRLIWMESRFKPGATSPAGAQGIAQFKPGTAAERGLLDPYDPEQAIFHAAKLLVDLEQQFGNIGLATAAYNAGSARVANWLARSGAISHETSAYVLALTGRTPEDWAWRGRAQPGVDANLQSCIEIARMLRELDGTDQAEIAPWGAQLAGNFSKAIALASFDRARQSCFGAVVGLRPRIGGTRQRTRGMLRFCRVFLPLTAAAPEDDRSPVGTAVPGHLQLHRFGPGGTPITDVATYTDQRTEF
jgi:hypothetical protein